VSHRIAKLQQTHETLESDLAQAKEQLRNSQQQQQGVSQAATSSSGAGDIGTPSATAAASYSSCSSGSDAGSTSSSGSDNAYIDRLSQLLDSSTLKIGQMQQQLEAAKMEFRYLAGHYCEEHYVKSSLWTSNQPSTFVETFQVLLDDVAAAQKDGHHLRPVTASLKKYTHEQKQAAVEAHAVQQSPDATGAEAHAVQQAPDAAGVEAHAVQQAADATAAEGQAVQQAPDAAAAKARAVQQAAPAAAAEAQAVQQAPDAAAAGAQAVQQAADATAAEGQAVQQAPTATAVEAQAVQQAPDAAATEATQLQRHAASELARVNAEAAAGSPSDWIYGFKDPLSRIEVHTSKMGQAGLGGVCTPQRSSTPLAAPPAGVARQRLAVQPTRSLDSAMFAAAYGSAGQRASSNPGSEMALSRGHSRTRSLHDRTLCLPGQRSKIGTVASSSAASSRTRSSSCRLKLI
jgi:hypothetical protein